MSASTSLNQSVCIEDIKTNIAQTFAELTSIWVDIYGENDLKKKSRLKDIEELFLNLCNELVQNEAEKKDALIERIGKSLEKKSHLEKLLKLDKNHVASGNDDLPLVDVDLDLLNIIDTYEVIKNSRMEKLSILQSMEASHCSFLGKPVSKLELENGSVPSDNELEQLSIKIKKLEEEKIDVINTFKLVKQEVASLVVELGLTELSKIERSVVENDEQFPESKANLDKLQKKLAQLRQNKEHNILEVQGLRAELKAIWPRIKRDPKDLEELLNKINGYSKNDIQLLLSEVNECKIIRKSLLKEVIESTRIDLEELWRKCCVSQEEIDLFIAYKSKNYTEDILLLHDLEIERLQKHYTDYFDIYELIKKRKTMWDRLEHLENEAKDPSRLFNNRGGQLLIEEKERKTIQKELPKLEKKLKSRITVYEEQENKPFLYFGEDLRVVIQQSWDEKNAQKENAKMARKIANIMTIQTESKLGSKSTLSANKRKLATSQTQLARKLQKTNASSTLIQSKQTHNTNQMGCPVSVLVPKTPTRSQAVSTPDVSALSSVASYNTFQENLDPATPNVAISTPSSRDETKTPQTRTPYPTRSRIPQFGNRF